MTVRRAALKLVRHRSAASARRASARSTPSSDRRADGSVYVRSPHALGPYAAKLTERLEHWAAHAPDRTFLARARRRRQRGGISRTPTRSTARGGSRRRCSTAGSRPSGRSSILSGNGIEHALLALAAMYAGVPYAPIAPAYSLIAREYGTLRYLMESLRPGLVFAADGDAFAHALRAVVRDGVEIVAGDVHRAQRLACHAASASWRRAPRRRRWTRRMRAVGPDTIAKVLFTSGSTGRPKGVITTQRMLCANQEMLRTVLAFLAEEPPVLCDWLPWNHIFGGNHNFGIVLYNGGTLYIDEGKPMPGAFDDHGAQPARGRVHRVLQRAARLRDAGAAAARRRRAARALLPPGARSCSTPPRAWASGSGTSCRSSPSRPAASACRMVTGLGATESAPFALCIASDDARAGMVGLPVPGVELKLVPVGDKLEARLRGPNITPGFWRDPELTRVGVRRGGLLPARRRPRCGSIPTIRRRGSRSTAGSTRTSSSRPAPG